MQANYSAAIVYNYKSDELIPMGGDSDDVIPSVFIGYTDAARLLKDYTYYTGGQEYVIRITDNPPFDINAYLLPFAVRHCCGHLLPHHAGHHDFQVYPIKTDGVRDGTGCPKVP